MLVFIRLNPIPPPFLPVKLLSKLTPGLLYFKLCCIYSFEVSHSMQQFGITGFFAFPAGSCTARPKINFFSNPYQPHTPVHPKRIETLRQQHLSSLFFANGLKFYIKPDQVNFAVSEKEKGATGVTALTRIKWTIMMVFWQRIALSENVWSIWRKCVTSLL